MPDAVEGFTRIVMEYSSVMTPYLPDLDALNDKMA
jgi:hypothetical protein